MRSLHRLECFTSAQILLSENRIVCRRVPCAPCSSPGTQTHQIGIRMPFSSIDLTMLQPDVFNGGGSRKRSVVASQTRLRVAPHPAVTRKGDAIIKYRAE